MLPLPCSRETSSSLAPHVRGGPLHAGQPSVWWAECWAVWAETLHSQVTLSRSSEVDHVGCRVWWTSRRGMNGAGCGHHVLACRVARKIGLKGDTQEVHETGERGIRLDFGGGVSRLERQHVQRPCGGWLPGCQWQVGGCLVSVAGGDSETIVCAGGWRWGWGAHHLVPRGSSQGLRCHSDKNGSVEGRVWMVGPTFMC